MPISIPSLDDIEFEQLFEEARALIPRYAPEWTDHNEHDPGITILQLLAWIIDQQIYQVGFVSDRYLKSFAALLGVKPKAAVPSRGLVWPKKNQGKQLVNDVELKRGEKVICIQQPELSFVLNSDIHLTSANLFQDSILAQIDDRKINLTHFNQKARSSFKFHPGKDNRKTFEISFDQPLIREGISPISLGIEIESIHPAIRSVHATPWGPLVIEYQTDSSFWQRVTIVSDSTFSLARTGVVLLKIPATSQANQSKLRIRLDEGYFPLPISIVKLELNVLPIVQLKEQAAKAIGISNGLPDQVFSVDVNGLLDRQLLVSPDNNKENRNKQDKTSNDEIFLHPFRLKVVEDNNLSEWLLVDELSKGKPDDQIYKLDKETNQITFGNGINGKIPPFGAQIFIEKYHITNGAEGNLASGLDWRIAGIQDGIFGQNPEPITGGENAWDIEKLISETRKQALFRQVLLSDDDVLEKIKALEGFGVARADILPRYHPAFPGEQSIPGGRTIVVTPWRNEEETLLINVQERYLNAIKNRIEPYRVIGERLTVITHQRVLIQVKAILLINTGKDFENIKNEAILRLKARFTDIELLATSDEPWPLGRSVTSGEIKTLLSIIPDVIAVKDCMLAKTGEPFSKQDIELKRDQVAIADEENISISFEFLSSR